jgi:cephalosporin hydroxylase
MNRPDDFEEQVQRNVEAQSKDEELQKASFDWFVRACRHNYCYGFTWLGLPMIQCPQDFVGLQEIIWNIKPDLIIETGVARGGSTVFFASMLELLGGDGRIIAIDIDIRDHNRNAIENHPLYKRIQLLEGSSVDENIAKMTRQFTRNKKCVMVCLDSNHTHEHVLTELHYYAPLVTPGSYCIVFDTGIEDFPQEMFTDRPWGKGNNPKTAVREFLETHHEFTLDRQIEKRLLITGARDGFLRRLPVGEDGNRGEMDGK